MRDEELRQAIGQRLQSWPLDRDQREVMRAIITSLFRPANKRYRGQPLWAYVRDLALYGSTSAQSLCRYLDLDPDQLVLVRRRW